MWKYSKFYKAYKEAGSNQRRTYLILKVWMDAGYDTFNVLAERSGVTLLRINRFAKGKGRANSLDVGNMFEATKELLQYGRVRGKPMTFNVYKDAHNTVVCLALPDSKADHWAIININWRHTGVVELVEGDRVPDAPEIIFSGVTKYGSVLTNFSQPGPKTKTVE